MSALNLIRRAAWMLGIDIHKHTPELNFQCIEKEYIRRLNIDLVLDVGANTGQFAMQLRHNIKYNGKLVSFEPLSSAIKSLELLSQNDSNWEIMPYALGDSTETSLLNIASNSQSSSLLPMREEHVIASPDSKYSGQEEIRIIRLDDIIDELSVNKSCIYMKIDTQGYEEKVLLGSSRALKKIKMIRMEMSLQPLYDGEILIDKAIQEMDNLEYQLIALEPVFSNKSNYSMLQIDGLFINKSDY